MEPTPAPCDSAPARPFDLTSDDLWDAWLRVQENEGCAGADGVTIDWFAENASRRLARLLESVEKDAYRALPLLKIVVEKSPGSGKLRRLLVPAVQDRVLQTAAAHHLSRSFEEEFLESSFAYRPGRSVDRAIARVGQWRNRGYRNVVHADIEGFFDHVDQGRLLSMLAAQNPSARLMDLLRQWVKASYWDGQRVRRVEAGIAQGSPLSPLLANFFLEPFDTELEKSSDHLVRYGDDFLVLCQTPEAAQQALALGEEFLARQNLSVSTEKTCITSFEEGFHFLGAFFLKEDVFVPWKREHRQGKLFFMARPMPAALLARYQRPEPRTALSLAFDRAGVSLGTSESQRPWERGRPAHNGADKERAGERPALPGGRMPVSYLYLTEQGAVLRKSGDRFLVEHEDQVELDLPYHKLESVLIFGNVQMTTQAMAELLDKGITVSLFTRQGRFRGSLDPPRGKNIELRVAQFEAYKDPARTLQFAHAAVEAKIANGLRVLERYADRQAQPPEYPGWRQTLTNALAALPSAANSESVLGIEGSAAHAQFSALMSFNRSPFQWPGRVRHPATDPLNALLSLGYTLVMHELSGLLSGIGLDAYLGYLHRVDYGRPSLSLDLLEPFRHPLVDRLVLTAVNKGMFEEGDFQPGGDREGLFLAPKPMRRFFAEYERWMIALPAEGEKRTHSFRDLLKVEAERFAATLREKREWVPFRFDQPEPEETCDTSSVTL